MRAVVQRVSSARVTVEGRVVGEIGRGLLVLLGVGDGDSPDDVVYTAAKVRELRVFESAEGKPMDQSVTAIGGALLVVSQFTLHGDVRKGRRPSFQNAAPADRARSLYEHFVAQASRGPVPVATGEFQAHMAVTLVNDGPVTMILDTAEWGA